MRILLLVSSFLIYYLSSSTNKDYQDFQESEQNSSFQYENNPSSFNTYSKIFLMKMKQKTLNLMVINLKMTILKFKRKLSIMFQMTIL
ncbi:MAG: hypothetical protein IPO92_18410 [Saprospiraceae bacterium]|nr:hypothetical protein [Saprospiraceae bacterium]